MTRKLMFLVNRKTGALGAISCSGAMAELEDRIRGPWEPLLLSDITRATQQITPVAIQSTEPTCLTHHTPMKRSNHFDGWFCPQKNPDGSYCKFTIK